jgi:DnaJ homolog subfamily C member 9
MNYALYLSNSLFCAHTGSQEEIEDIKTAYISSGGSIEEIMRNVIHSTYEDEPRFIKLIDELIKSKGLKSTTLWKTTAQDEKARLVREKQGKKEAAEAEALARDLGVWDEFYGSGKEGARRGKGKGQAKKTAAPDNNEDVEDTAALQALILKRKKNMDGFFDGLAAKYGEPEPMAKGKKGKRKKQDVDEEEDSPKKKNRRAVAAPEIPDDEFEALQQKLFGDKAKPTAPGVEKEQRNTRKKAK